MRIRHSVHTNSCFTNSDPESGAPDPVLVQEFRTSWGRCGRSGPQEGIRCTSVTLFTQLPEFLPPWQRHVVTQQEIV